MFSKATYTVLPDTANICAMLSRLTLHHVDYIFTQVLYIEQIFMMTKDFSLNN